MNKKFSRAAFDTFVQQHIEAQGRIPDKLTKPRKGRRVTYRKFDPYLPRARGKRSKLIPIPGKFPCDDCADARFNRACAKLHECMCYAFWGVTRVNAFPLPKTEDTECSVPSAECTTPVSPRKKAVRSASPAQRRCSTRPKISSGTRRSGSPKRSASRR